jgi:hypothetical protein
MYLDDLVYQSMNLEPFAELIQAVITLFRCLNDLPNVSGPFGSSHELFGHKLVQLAVQLVDRQKIVNQSEGDGRRVESNLSDCLALDGQRTTSL